MEVFGRFIKMLGSMQHLAAASTAATDEMRVLVILRLEHKALLLGLLDKPQRLFFGDHPSFAQIHGKINSLLEQNTRLSDLTCLTRMTGNVLSLSTNTIHHRKGSRRFFKDLADVIVIAYLELRINFNV